MLGDKKPVLMESDKGVTVATLGEDGKLTEGQLPELSTDKIAGLTEALEGKADLRGGKLKSEQLPEDVNAATLEGNSASYFATAEALAEKQDKLTGEQGQIVGFDENGNAQAQAAPESGVNIGTSTNATGLLKGADGAVAQAEGGVDYVTPEGLTSAIQSAISDSWEATY